MLKLKRVDLLGFKSFCERTELRFNGGGIAAIVGPNGCGKSNLSDAVSWVLGEQSVKLLRGTRMEDVIFNGTRERKPLGMASVTVTLIDPEISFYQQPASPAPAGEALEESPDTPPERPGEITVTRRLFRSGESEYLLNGRICRLRDIQEIFMGTGLGPECYAIIEQGRVGQILSSRPHDRRAVVEEAAGITKFKTKKKLAEAKLESARQNLSRVNDIFEEVNRQVNSLKRQAAKARRFEELRREMAEKLTVALGSKYRAMERQAVQAALEMNLASDEVRSRKTGVERLEAEHAGVQKESLETELHLQARREEASAATIEIDRARQRMGYQARLAEENEGRIRQWESEEADLVGRLEELGREMAAERKTSDTLTEEISQLRERLTEKTADLDSLQFQVRQQETQQEGLRERVLRLLSEISLYRNQLAQIEEFLAGLARQAARARGEQITAQQEIEQLSGEGAALRRQLAQQQAEIQAIEERRRKREAVLREWKQEAQSGRQQADGLRDEISRLQARSESLEQILSHRAYTTEVVKNLFTAISRGRLGDFRAKGILADFVEVEESFEKAVEGFLREELEYVVVESWPEAEKGMRLLRAEMQGHATFVVAPEKQPEALPPVEPGTGVVGRLADHLQLSNGLAGSVSSLLPRLNGCYLVEDETAARLLCDRNPELHFLLADGRWYHGRTLSGGTKASSGPLALKRELRELTPRLTAAVKLLDEKNAALSEMEARIAAESKEWEEAGEQLRLLETSALASGHQWQQIEDRGNRAQSWLSVARLEIERLGEESARATVEQQQNQAEAGQREASRRQVEESLAEAREAIARDQQQAARAAEEQAALRAQLAALDERRKAALASAGRVEQMLAEQARRRDEIAARKMDSAAERDRLLADNTRLSQQIASLAVREQELEKEARGLDSALQERRARLGAIEEELKTQQQELEEARERRSAIEIQLVRLQSDLKHLEETCLNELGRPVRQIAAGEGVPLTPEALEASEQDYLRLKQKIEDLGPVNPLALEEFQQAQQRLEFLDTQRGDLFDSIRDTQQAISEIDSVSRKQFLEAFEEINRYFRQTFAGLFGGGLGEMRLTDETNIAETGIDVVASPPGKKLQNVLLLSGGEKALTAIALLMAVFRYQPSPFCILDEVDAPLDEPNIARFTRLIRQMSEQTQFILITHSRTTMEVAETLYGVTMQEPGVSKLVSVRLAGPEAPSPAREVEEAVLVRA